MDKSISISVEKMEIGSILSLIEEQCSCKFAYRVFDLSQIKSFQYEGHLKGALEELFRNDPIDFKSI